MSYSNTTQNRQLPVWVGSDPPEREDFNRAMQIMDAIGAAITLGPPSFATKAELEAAYPSGDGIYSHVAGGVIYVWAGEWVATGINLSTYALLADVYTREQAEAAFAALVHEHGNIDNDGKVTFSAAEELGNLVSGEALNISLGKLMKWYAAGAAGLLSKSTVAEVKTALGIGQTIYSGTLSVSGNANIPEVNNYTIYSAFVSGAGTAIGIRTGTLINIFLLFAYQGNQYINIGTIDISGTTCTFSLFNQIAHNAGSNHGAATTSATITSIAGIV